MLISSHRNRRSTAGLIHCVCVYYCSTYYKAVREGGGGGNGGHVLRETTSRGLCELVCSSRTKTALAGARGQATNGPGGFWNKI
jgi:hypothetical protein